MKVKEKKGEADCWYGGKRTREREKLIIGIEVKMRLRERRHWRVGDEGTSDREREGYNLKI